MWSRKQFKVFLSFLVFGIIIGLVENLLAIYFATSHPIDVRAVVVSLLVVIPFAALGELIVDRHSLIPHARSRRLRRVEVFLEFLVFGMVMGVVEDLIVITLLTGEPVTWGVVGIVFVVTLPFAVLGELVVDQAKWFVWLQSKGLFVWVGKD